MSALTGHDNPTQEHPMPEPAMTERQWTEEMTQVYDLTGCPDVATKALGRPRIFQPTVLTVDFHRSHSKPVWGIVLARISGTMRLTSGKLGSAQQWSVWYKPTLSELPGWLAPMVGRAVTECLDRAPHISEPGGGGPANR